MATKIENLWQEKLLYDQHPENSVLQAREWDSIASCILRNEESATTELEIQAVEWAKRRIGN